METKIGYKVLLYEYDKYWSYIRSYFARRGVEYSTEFFTTPEPHAGPLAVFDSLFSVRNFISNGGVDSGRFRLFEVEYEESNGKAVWHPNGYRERLGKTFLPVGTILATRIKLIKEIKI